MIRHPRFRMLVRYALHELGAEQQHAVGDHVQRCQHCRDTIDSLRRTAQLARSTASPLPDDALLQSILHSRAVGLRVALPAAAQLHRKRAAAWLTAAAVAGIAITSVLLQRTERSERLRNANGPEFGITIGFLPRHAVAQTGPVTLTRRLAPLPILRGDRLRAGSALYQLTVRRDGRAVEPPESARVTVASDTFQGRPAWRVESGWLGHEHDMRERILLDRKTLRPLYRLAHNVGHSRFTVEQYFAGDSLRGTMSTTSRRSVIARELPNDEGPYLIGEGALMVLMRSLDLRPRLRGSVALVGWGAVKSDLIYPVNVAVMGEDRVYALGREWDAWRVIVRVGAGLITVWVRKEDGLALRAFERSGNTDNEITLLEESYTN